MTIEEYVRSKTRDFDTFLTPKVVRDDENNGFYALVGDNWSTIIHVPKSAKRLTWAVKKTLDHELGHAVFWHLRDSCRLRHYMNVIKERKVFCFLQKIWYWNPIIRRIKRLLGFSTKINYKKEDIYYMNWTREENELFCDHYAWFGLKH